MRPFPQVGRTISTGRTAEQVRVAALLLLVLVAVGAWTVGCAAIGKGTGAAPTPTPTPPTPTPVSVAVMPTSAAVLLGNSQKFTATVTNASNTSVVWSVNGVLGGTATTGRNHRRMELR